MFVGLVVPTIPALAQPPVPVPSSCFMLTNMFDPSKENQPDWETDISDDVLEECAEFGEVLHVHVDVYSKVKERLEEIVMVADNCTLCACRAMCMLSAKHLK